MDFDILLRGGTVVDGTGAPGRRADVGVVGERIAAIGDLAAVEVDSVALLLDARGRVVCPGFIDPHGHSDASLLIDGGMASHLHQGFTTQLSGNCGDSAAPVTDRNRDLVEASLRELPNGPAWRTFAEYLEAVDAQRLAINVALLVGHGTIRGGVLGPADRAPDETELTAMRREVELAMAAGALGLSSGLIYAPGMHARPDEVAALVSVAAGAGGLYATHMRNEADGLFASLDESVAAVRSAGTGARLQVSHLKAASRPVHGRAAEAVAVLERARADGLDVAADQYPYTAAATVLATVLPPEVLAAPTLEVVAALRDPASRRAIRATIDAGRSGWENVAGDPGWDGIVVSWSGSRPEWAGRSLGDLGRELDRDPADLAFDVLADDALETDCVIECMTEADVETILAVPWIAVCTDAEARRPGHPILDAGVPHPRTYGTTARVLGRYVRERRVLSLEGAIAKLTSVPATRLGLVDRGVLREGAFADLVLLDPDTVADTATYPEPARYPRGIDAVVVNGTPAVVDGEETGLRSGRLLRGR
jgi:N-acyl-D-amino-acid deacylase